MLFLFGLCSLICVQPSSASESALEKFLSPLDEDQIFYRWQSTVSGENLVQAGVMTEDLNRHFMTRADKIAAGPGLYVAQRELSSAEYLPKDGGNLIEVHVPKGTEVLDLGDSSVASNLAKVGITEQMIHDGYGARNGLMIHYANDWYVGKNLTGKVRFKMYPSADQQPKEFISALSKAENAESFARAKDQMYAQISRAPAELRRRLFRTEPLHPLHLALFTPAEIEIQLESAIRFDNTKSSSRHILDLLGERTDVREHLSRQRPVLYANLVERITPGPDANVTDERLAKFTKVVLGETDETRRHARILKLITQELTGMGLERTPEQTAQRLVPLFGAVELTAAERRTLELSLAKFAHGTGLRSEMTSALRTISGAAHLGPGSPLMAEIRHLELKGQVFNKAVSTRSIDDVVEALRLQQTIAHLDDVHKALRGRVPNRVISAAENAYFERHAAEFRRLFSTPKDFADGAEARIVTRGTPFDLLYERALHAGTAERMSFLKSCVAEAWCVDKLDAHVIHDSGRIFANLVDLPELAPSLQRLVGFAPEHADRLLAQMLESANPSGIRMALVEKVRVGRHGLDVSQETIERLLAPSNARVDCLSPVLDLVR